MKILFFTLILCLTIQLSTSCSCLRRSLQDALCDSDYAIKVNVYNEVDPKNYQTYYRNPEEKYYYFNISYIFKKANKDVANALKTKVFITHPEGATCGTDLILNKDYLVVAYVDKATGRLPISLCSYIKRWDSLTTDHKVIIKAYWKYHCDCKQIYCDQECQKSNKYSYSTNETCRLCPTRKSFECFTNFALRNVD